MSIKLNYIAKYLKKKYLSLGAIKKIGLLKHNNINSTNYFISTDKGKYVLRNFTDGSRSKKIEKICGILIFCIKNQANVVEPIKNKNNCYVDKKRKIYLTRYYEGELYKGTNSELEEVAKNLAILHSVLSRNPIKYSYRTNYNYYKNLTQLELKRIKTIVTLKKERNVLDKKVLKNFDYLVKSFSEDEKTTKIFNNLKLKKQLIHHDFHPGNVIFIKNKVAAILDFNSMRKGEKIEDIAFACFRFSSYKTNNINKIKKGMKLFIDSYLLYNDINREEISCLDYYFIHKILGRLSYILKKRYFANSDLWSIDFDKNMHFLKLAKK